MAAGLLDTTSLAVRRRDVVAWGSMRQLDEAAEVPDEGGGRATAVSGFGQLGLTGQDFLGSMFIDADSSEAAGNVNDQRWTLMRKKIGLSRKTRKTKTNLNKMVHEKLGLIFFIRVNIKRKECVSYVFNEKHRSRMTSNPCFCGGKLDEHYALSHGGSLIDLDARNAIPEESPTADDAGLMGSSEPAWSPLTAIKEFPTNAFGLIEFINEEKQVSKPAKYVRLSEDTSMSDVEELLCVHWKLREGLKPMLVIGVLGGAKHFKLDGKRKEIFATGLVKAVKSTNAWILSGGQNVGYSKLVGDCVRASQYTVTAGNRLVRGIRCIGVCPWGYIEGRNYLTNDDDDDEMDGPNGGSSSSYKVVRYKTNSEVRTGYPVSLNSDHTHFLMVDDGMRNHFSDGVGNFRAKMERYIRDPEGMSIPLVTLLLEGGVDSIKDTYRRVNHGIPVVVLEGTGRAADIIAYVYHHFITTATGERVIKQNHVQVVRERLQSVYGYYFKKYPETLDELVEMLLFCGKRDHLITVFNINCERDLDLTILSALLKADSQSSRVDHLRLALSWNRPDIAEEQIFAAEHKAFPEGSLDEIFLEALKTERIDFVRLLLMNGVSIEEFLSPSRLRELYTHSVVSNNHLRHLFGVTEGNPRVHLSQVSALIRRLTRKFSDPVYDADKPDSFRKKLPAMKKASRQEQTALLLEEELTNPLEDIFYWAVLSAMPEVAQVFWERCHEQIKLSVVATALFNGLLLTIRKDSTRKRNLYDKARTMFERLAVAVIDLCYERDRDKAMSLVERRNKRFGEQTSLELAQVGNARSFIATPCCQNSMEQMWIRGMSYCSWFRVLITLFCPFFVASNWIKFMPLGDNGGELTFSQKILTFYKAPITKFVSNTLTYIAYLGLYSYMVLFDLRYRMTLSELVILVWSLIYFIEETREIAFTPSSTLNEKLRFWKNSIWNTFDAMAYVFGFLGFGLRFSKETFPHARTVYAVNTGILYMRLLRAFHASYRLGPKLVTFYRMIAEVAMFLLMLGVFLLGYGIASQALHDPFQAPSLSVFVNNIIYIPYWQMYGELQLETLEVGDENQNRCVDSYCEDLERYEWVRQMLLAFYLIVSNILLLNMLIAVFTYVFDEVHENSMEIWKYEMFRLVQEYDEKPGLAPPFIIFEHIWLLLKGIWKRCCRREKEDLDSLMKTTVEMLRIYEKECAALYVNDKKNNMYSSMEERVRRVQESIEELLKRLDDATEDGEWVDALTQKYEAVNVGGASDSGAELPQHDGEIDSGRGSESSLDKLKTDNVRPSSPRNKRMGSSCSRRGLSHATATTLKEMIHASIINEQREEAEAEKILQQISPRGSDGGDFGDSPFNGKRKQNDSFAAQTQPQERPGAAKRRNYSTVVASNFGSRQQPEPGRHQEHDDDDEGKTQQLVPAKSRHASARALQGRGKADQFCRQVDTLHQRINVLESSVCEMKEMQRSILQVLQQGHQQAGFAQDSQNEQRDPDVH